MSKISRKQSRNRKNKRSKKQYEKSIIKSNWKDPKDVTGFDINKSEYNNRGRRYFESYSRKEFKQGDLIFVDLNSKFLTGYIYCFAEKKNKIFAILKDCEINLPYSLLKTKSNRVKYEFLTLPYSKLSINLNTKEYKDLFPKKTLKQNYSLRIPAYQIFPKLFKEIEMRAKKEKEDNAIDKENIRIDKFLMACQESTITVRKSKRNEKGETIYYQVKEGIISKKKYKKLRRKVLENSAFRRELIKMLNSSTNPKFNS